MIRLAGAWLLASIMVGSSGSANAAGRDPVEFRLETGISAMTSPRQYSAYAEFPGASPIMGVGVGVRAARFAVPSLELGFLSLGPGVVSGGWMPEIHPTVDRSSLLTAMLALEWNQFSGKGQGPFVSGSIGWGRGFLGGLELKDMLTQTRTQIRGTRVTGPAFSLATGMRTPPLLGGPNLQFGVRLIELVTRRRTMSVVPLTASLVF